MSVHLQQGSHYEGEDWWKWWVWLDGPDSELDRIDHVVYTLHRTFPNPVRTINDRKSKFRLETGGWGNFRIFAKIVRKDQSEEKTHCDLELRYQDGRVTGR